MTPERSSALLHEMEKQTTLSIHPKEQCRSPLQIEDTPIIINTLLFRTKSMLLPSCPILGTSTHSKLMG
ncbi:hypothetical protein JTE90_022250 [Oedothorax gibbosus]|uniref:Uncharacterized protein n=1 Tax=Oedothorax gibbosus TaxID=931172 RepID=A0AAV6VY07_9ARAC|nr:hypothetical protein JTE90_022250 [Oedothorax gibbosus]